MALLGRALLILGLLACVYGIGASIYGARTGRRPWVDSGRRAVYALAALLTAAFVILEAAFLRSDFSYSLVASHSSTTTPIFYRATAAWSSQEGSLLLWVWLLSLWSSLVLFMTRRRLREIAPYATAVLLGFGGFFCVLTIFFAKPFGVLPAAMVPAEGAGLTPLLRYPSMMIHPPMVYSGYTLFTIPFAFGVGALITGRLGNEWIAATRRFALAAWFLLGIGILLGARWSYSELGWGGYWAWDPVENASLMPWLTGTAFLHSVMIQEKRGMMKAWNASLVLGTGILAVMGTFLVRSGILSSIHAFGASTLKYPFFGLMFAMIAGSVGLVIWRSELLRSEHRLDSLLSREAVFLVQNVVLVALTFVIFFFTWFPLISELFTGRSAAIGPPVFTTWVVPLTLVLVLLTGVGPVIAWRRMSWAGARRAFLVPVAATALALVVLVAVGGIAHKPYALTMFCLGAFVLTCVGQEFARGARARRAMTSEARPRALASLVRRNRRRYGGYIVHAGFAVMLLGVAGSSAFQHAADVSLRPGQSARVNGYDIRYVKPTASSSAEKITLGAVLDVSKRGRHVASLSTTRGFYPSTDPADGILGRYFGGEATSEVGLRAGLLKDIWTDIHPDIAPLKPIIDEGNRRFGRLMRDLAASNPTAAEQRQAASQVFALVAIARDGIARRFVSRPWPATFRLIVSPIVTWIWLGALIIVAGGLIALWPAPELARRRLRAAYSARVGRELLRP
ncbi:MAG: cytochrome c-type biosis protein CcmF [Solirubrobacteraceae bacterium]|nr:cytochrome c-type biosis protein CcmF [Solirubrobacteraceae bacterium]